MSLPDIIKAPITGELERYEEYLKDTLRSEHAMTNTMLDYIFDSRGKAIRPALVMLSAGLYAGNRPFPDDTRLAAMLVEMVHTASLVHDDVIDEALIRRGKPSAKAMWRSHRAVIIGDYILAKSFLVGMQSRSYGIVSYLSGSMTDLCEGELLQSEQSDKLEMTREVYLEIIYKKTASLLSMCSGVGALSVGAPSMEVEAMQEFGKYLGMAFQIRDDILDYAPAVKTGKPMYGDIREKKITLPLLTVLEKSSPQEHNRVLDMVKNVVEEPSNVDLIGDLVKQREGIGMATEVMNEYLARAGEILLARPASSCRDSLEALCSYIGIREM